MAKSVKAATAPAVERIRLTFGDLENFTWLLVSVIWTIVFLSHLSDARMVLDTYQISAGFNFEDPSSDAAFGAHSAFSGGDLDGEPIRTYFANWFMLLPGGGMWYLYGSVIATAQRATSNRRGVRNFRVTMGCVVAAQLVVIAANVETLNHATSAWLAFS